MIISVHNIDYLLAGQWCTASLICETSPDFRAITKEIISGEFDFGPDGKLRMDLSNGYLLVKLCNDELYEGELRLALITALLNETRVESSAFSLSEW